MNVESLLCLNETKLLSVIINCKLSWSNHIKLIASKIGKSIGILYKVRYILSPLDAVSWYTGPAHSTDGTFSKLIRRPKANFRQITPFLVVFSEYNHK